MKLYYHSFLDIVSMFHSCKMQCQLHANVFFFCRGGVLSVWMTEVLNQTPVLFNVNGNTIIDTNLLVFLTDQISEMNIKRIFKTIVGIRDTM